MKLAELNLDEAAKQAAGNWKHFDCFVWFRRSELEDPEQWAVVYTNHRDSGLIDQSNAAVTARLLQPFSDGDDPDVVPESHSHWAVGYLDGFSLRVFKNGEITEAFKTYYHVMQCLDDYPIPGSRCCWRAVWRRSGGERARAHRSRFASILMMPTPIFCSRCRRPATTRS